MNTIAHQQENIKKTGDNFKGVYFKDVHKYFGSFQALKGINLSLEFGKIYGIVGENGAGKTTLMNILYGMYFAEKGSMQMDGHLYHPKSPSDAIHHGINMVHQHFMLVDYYSCLENIILGETSSIWLRSSLKNARKKVESILDKLGFDIDINTKVEKLPIGAKQSIEIVRAIYKGTRILILDEPTAVLTPIEVRKFFDLLRTLKEDGITVVLITHKLREVLEITDEVAVMRHGELVGTTKTSESDGNQLTKWMVGEPIQTKRFQRPQCVQDKKIIRFSNVTYKDKDNVSRLQNINFDVHAGEIVGVAGVAGNGQSQLIQLLLAVMSPTKGIISFKDHDFVSSITSRDLRKYHMGFVPEDRLKEGLVGQFSAYENMILGYHTFPQYSRNGFISSKKIIDICLEKMKEFDIRPQDPKKQIRLFSGGNQQKLIVAREMMHKPKAMIIAEPTRGVDVGAILQIHKQIMNFRDQGCAILLISSELEELLNLSDRIMVLYKGNQVALLDVKNENSGAMEDELAQYMMGMKT